MERVEIMELDPIDRKLLSLLQEDAKLPYAKLGKRLGISSSGVHKRIKRLIDEKVIKNFTAILDPQMIGKKLKVFVGISTAPGTCGEVIRHLINRPEVLEVYEMAGEHDLFLKLITEDTSKLYKILHEIDRIPGISNTKTMVVLKTEKEMSAAPMT